MFPRLLTLLLSFKDALYTNSERTEFKSISSYSGQEVCLVATPSIKDFLLLIVVESSGRVRSVMCRCLLLLRFEVILTEECAVGLFEACGQFRPNRLRVKRVAI